MKTKEDIIKEITELIDRLEDACGIEQESIIEKLRSLVQLL